MKPIAVAIALVLLSAIGTVDATTITGQATQTVGASLMAAYGGTALDSLVGTISVSPGGTVSPSAWSLGTTPGTYSYDPDGNENVQVTCDIPTTAWTLQVKDNTGYASGRMHLNGNGVALANPLQARRYGGSTISVSGSLQTVATGTGSSAVDIVLSQTTVSSDYANAGPYNIILLWQATGTF